LVTNTSATAYIIYNGTTMALNQGNSLNANAGYTFSLPMVSGDSLNVQFNTTCVVNVWVDQGVV
jgi:hypothetical protein